MAKSTKTRLKEIALQDEPLTQAQRDYIVEQSTALGVVFEPHRTQCGDCYRDQAAILWRKAAEDEAKKTTRKYILRQGVDVIWRGVRINMTLTDAELADVLRRGFPQDYFIRIDGQDGSWL